MSTIIYGVGLSPYVRKVKMALEFKGLEYEQIDVIPTSDTKPAEFVQHSPLGKIPLVKIDDIYLPDSAVILAYLERSRPTPPLLSGDPKLAAKSLWFEQYAASHMVSVISGHLFAELILAPNFFNRASNLEEIELAKTKEIPEIFDYIESQLITEYLVGDTLGHADISVASALFTLQHCDYACDSSKWPKTAEYINRLSNLPSHKNLLSQETNFLKAIGAAS